MIYHLLFIIYHLSSLTAELPAAEEAAAAFEFGAEVETDVGGLVVAHVLHDEAVAIDGFREEGVETVLGGDGRDVEAQVAVVLGACQHLLAPVAQHIGAEGGVGLGAVVEGAIGELGQSSDRSGA